MIVAISGILSTLLYGILELRFLKNKKYVIESERIPDSLDGKKIALISDIHGISQGKDNYRLIKLLKKSKPDFIVISGDLINGRDEKELTFAFGLIRKLKALGVPVLYTFGNHEEKLKNCHPESYRRLRWFCRKKIILLNNKAYCPENTDGVVFVGLNLPLYMYHAYDSNGFIKRQSSKILKDIDTKESFKILISHDPEHIDAYADSGYDICLSGHLHGGVIYIPGIGGLITPRLQLFHKLAKGVHQSGNMKMIVSGGVGWHDIPIRLFNHPEIVNIEFKKLKG